MPETSRATFKTFRSHWEVPAPFVNTHKVEMHGVAMETCCHDEYLFLSLSILMIMLHTFINTV